MELGELLKAEFVINFFMVNQNDFFIIKFLCDHTNFMVNYSFLIFNLIIFVKPIEEFMLTTHVNSTDFVLFLSFHLYSILFTVMWITRYSIPHLFVFLDFPK